VLVRISQPRPHTVASRGPRRRPIVLRGLWDTIYVNLSQSELAQVEKSGGKEADGKRMGSGWEADGCSVRSQSSAVDGPMPRSGWMNPMRVAVAVVDMLVLRYQCQLTEEEDKLLYLADLSREWNSER
jgi:hypothetical protein